MTDIESLLADVLMDDSQEDFQEKFVKYLVMEVFIGKLRAQGMSNADIYRVCLELDNEHQT